MITIAAYDIHVEQLLEKMTRFHRALSEAGIPYRIVGELAIFPQVSARDPDKARMTRDIDVAVDRQHLEKIISAAEKHGFRYRHAAGIDTLEDASEKKARSAVYLIFPNEKVRPDIRKPYLRPSPLGHKRACLWRPWPTC